MPSAVAEIPAAESEIARRHFAARLTLETDCADVQAGLSAGAPDFILIDVRGPQAYAAGHVPGALNLPHRRIEPETLARFPAETLFVVYCAGPHCNGGDRGALRLAEHGRPVKLMIGGITGWLDEGFSLAEGDAPSSLAD